jgi:hypothetical protein
MNESIDIEVVRAEALRKLGRNVVNFSKIEAALKYLLAISQFKISEEKISEQLLQNQTRLHKQTLGKLVQEFHKNVVTDASPADIETASANPGFSLYFKVTCDDTDFLKDQKRELSAIVAERNKLIHQDLALLDTSCVGDCQKLISLLDEQNPRLLAHLEDLAWIIDALGNNLRALEDFLKSPEFLQSIQPN